MNQAKWDQRFLDLAAFISNWSKDPSTQVGAVIVDRDNRVVSLGYNGFARGVKDLPERYENRELKYQMVVHAEENAVLFAQRDLKGCTIYTWPMLTCASCCAKIIQTGIRRVVSRHNSNPRWVDSFNLAMQMYSEAGVRVVLYPEVGSK